MKKFNILCLAAAIAAPLLTGCSSGSDTPDEPTAPDTASYTITLVAKDGGMNSRAGLTPEAARGNENKLYNVTILLSRKSLNATDLTDKDKIEYVFYYGNLGGVTQATNLAINKVLTGTYYAIALANFYNDTNEETNKTSAINYWKGKSLSYLRDAAYEDVPFENIGNNDVKTYDRFRMTSDEEKPLDFSTDAVNGTVLTVERLTSRVDLKIKGLASSASEDGTYKIQLYLCDADGNPSLDEDNKYVPVEGCYLTLNSLFLENFNKESTYYIQRSALDLDADGTTDLTYFGDEAFGENTLYPNYASRYVITPETYGSEPTTITLGNYGWLNKEVNSDDQLLSQLFCSDHLLTDNNASDETDPYYTITYVGEYTNYNYTDNEGNFLDTENGSYPYLKLNYEYSSPTFDMSIEDTGKLELPFLHTTATGPIDYRQPMAIAIIRNTIYRFSLCFFTNNKLLYVRWYYYSGSGSSLEQTSYGAAINSIIANGKGGNPND